MNYLHKVYNRPNAHITDLEFDAPTQQAIIDIRQSAGVRVERCVFSGYQHHGIRIAAGSTAYVGYCVFNGTENHGAALKTETGANAFFSECDISNHLGTGIKVDGQSNAIFLAPRFGEKHGKAAIVVAGGSHCTIVDANITGGDIWAYSPLTLINCHVERRIRVNDPDVLQIIRPRNEYTIHVND